MSDTKRALVNLIGRTPCCGFSSRAAVESIADNLIANGVTVQNWIPVTERLPEDRGDVLVVAWSHEKWQAMVGWYADTSNIWHILTPDGFFPWDHVTHWMPLPEPPKGE